MKRLIALVSAAVILCPFQAWADQRIICTLAVELGSNKDVMHEGQCDERMSSASTFKIAISLMGFDSGILTSPDTPEWPFLDGYVDWVSKWRQATTPESWMRDSVVWYSQLITERLGQERFAAYVDAFDYGNRDVSGDAGMSNGLTSAWLSSSLQISPVEQVGFVSRMIQGELPVDDLAVAKTKQLMMVKEPFNGWTVYGKTGAGFPFGEDGTRLRGQPFGWYVGWAENGDRTVVFARLVRFDARPTQTPGVVARDGTMDALFATGGALN